MDSLVWDCSIQDILTKVFLALKVIIPNLFLDIVRLGLSLLNCLVERNILRLLPVITFCILLDQINMDNQGQQIKPQPRETHLRLLKHLLIKMILKFGLEFMRLVVEESSRFAHHLQDRFGHGAKATMASQGQQDKLKINLLHKKSILKDKMKRILKFYYLMKLK